MHAQQLPFSIPQVAEVRGFVFIFVIVLLLLNYTLGHLPTFLEKQPDTGEKVEVGPRSHAANAGTQNGRQIGWNLK